MPRQKSTPPPSPAPTQIEVIDPLWLLKAIGVTLLAALVCAYLAVCLLFYQGQWQLILHPVRSDRSLAQLAGLPATPVRFDATETGSPRLSGVYIPAPPGTPYARYLLLYLRGGDSTLAESPSDAANLALLHGLGLPLFAFDFRGFGASDPVHPNLERMTGDSQAALRYVLQGRGVSESQVILYGAGTGASLALSLAAAHPQVPAVILDSPIPDALSTVLVDPRTRILPVRALFHERFSLDGLPALRTPKLLISYPTERSTGLNAFRSAADPKTILSLSPGDSKPLAPAIARFLDEYLPPKL